MKLKSAEVKGKLLEYIVNPTGNVNNTERHVSSSDKVGKRYRNMAPVFSIDDDQDPPGTISLVFAVFYVIIHSNIVVFIQYFFNLVLCF